MNKEEVIEILERFVLGAKPCSQREIVDACASAYRMLKEQPFLPSNLVEAAIDAAQLDMQDRQIMEATNDERLRYSRIFRRGFKAGAEWMAGQGVTLEGRVCKDEYAEEAPFYYVETENSDDLPIVGDKVVVQIRKK